MPAGPINRQPFRSLVRLSARIDLSNFGRQQVAVVDRRDVRWRRRNVPMIAGSGGKSDKPSVYSTDFVALFCSSQVQSGLTQVLNNTPQLILKFLPDSEVTNLTYAGSYDLDY